MGPVVIPAPALANGSPTSEFGKQLENVSASLEAAAPDVQEAAPAKLPQGSGKHATVNESSRPLTNASAAPPVAKEANASAQMLAAWAGLAMPAVTPKAEPAASPANRTHPATQEPTINEDREPAMETLPATSLPSASGTISTAVRVLRDNTVPALAASEAAPTISKAPGVNTGQPAAADQSAAAEEAEPRATVTLPIASTVNKESSVPVVKSGNEAGPAIPAQARMGSFTPATRLQNEMLAAEQPTGVNTTQAKGATQKPTPAPPKSNSPAAAQDLKTTSSQTNTPLDTPVLSVPTVVSAPVLLPEASAAADNGSQVSNAKAATGTASVKTQSKSQSKSAVAQGAQQPLRKDANTAAPTTAPSPTPASFAENRVPFAQTEGLQEQMADSNTPSSQPRTDTAGTQAAGIAAASPALPNPGNSQISGNGPRTFKGVTTTNGSGSTGSTNEMAFAAKVQPAVAAKESSTDSSRRSVAEAPASATPLIRKSAVEADSPIASAPAAVPAALTNASISHVDATFQQSENQTSVSQIKTEADAPVTQAPDLRAAPQGQPTVQQGPLKDVSLSVEPVQGQKVEIRVVERAGEVRVAVHAPNSEVAQGLRQNLSELSDRLTETGYHTETWRPAASEAPATASDNKNSSGNPGGGDSQQQQNSSQQGRGQREQNQSNRPRWVQEFETSLTTGTASTGDSNGFSS
jgi:hypothetical protein